METAGNILLKSFMLGVLIGYLTGYFIRRGIKTILFLIITIAIFMYLTGQAETLLSLWNFSGDFLMKLSVGAINIMRTRLEPFYTSNPWVFGFIAGCLWSLTRRK